MRTFLKSKKGIAALIATLVVAISAVGAFAYFTSTGTGTGSATVGTSTTWAVTTDAATGGVLTPGGLSLDTIAYHVKNNNAGQQNLANVAVKVALADGTAWTSGTCSKNDFSISGAVAGATFNDTAQAANLAPGATATGSVTLKMVDTGLNQDDCKGVTVPLHLFAS
jgi:uncharacterized repeat protein (TIGR01451 family)